MLDWGCIDRASVRLICSLCAFVQLLSIALVLLSQTLFLLVCPTQRSDCVLAHILHLYCHSIHWLCKVT